MNRYLATLKGENIEEATTPVLSKPPKVAYGSFGSDRVAGFRENRGDTAPVHRCWRVAYPNGAAIEVLFTPPATRARVAELHPGADIEPVRDAPTLAATPTEAVELRLLISQVLAASDDNDRQEALRVALADVDAGLTCLRALAIAMQRRP